MTIQTQARVSKHGAPKRQCVFVGKFLGMVCDRTRFRIGRHQQIPVQTQRRSDAKSGHWNDWAHVSGARPRFAFVHHRLDPSLSRYEQVLLGVEKMNGSNFLSFNFFVFAYFLYFLFLFCSSPPHHHQAPRIICWSCMICCNSFNNNIKKPNKPNKPKAVPKEVGVPAEATWLRWARFVTL